MGKEKDKLRKKGLELARKVELEIAKIPNDRAIESSGPCLWHIVADGEKCPLPAVAGTDYCRSHIKVLEKIAVKSMARGTDGMFGVRSKTYMENLVIVLLTAAGTATGQILINNWDVIWSRVSFGGMSPPGLGAYRNKKEIFIGRFGYEEDEFYSHGLGLIPRNKVVSRFIEVLELEHSEDDSD